MMVIDAEEEFLFSTSFDSNSSFDFGKRLYPVILANFPDMVITSSILFNRFNSANFGYRRRSVKC